MNPAAIGEFVTLWLIVNVSAILVLAVMSYIGSVFVLDGLESLDKWLYASRYKRGGDAHANTPETEVSAQPEHGPATAFNKPD